MTRTLAAALLLCTPVGLAAAGDYGIDTDSIAKDRAMIGRLAAALPPGAGSAKAWIGAVRLPATKPEPGMTDDGPPSSEREDREDRDVGAGAHRVVLDLAGGYLSAQVCALVREDRVVEVEVRCPMTGGSDTKEAATAVRDAWGKVPVVTDEEGFRYAWFDDARRKAHRAALAEEFGPRCEASVPDALRKEFDLLDGALSDLLYGRSYSDDGGPPPGRAALEALVSARAAGLLRALLRSPNPEGRLYALEGLERLAKEGAALTDADRAAIAAIKASPVPIHLCSGCLVSTGTAAEALRRQREHDEAMRDADKGE
jgi:hypothetical protein